MVTVACFVNCPEQNDGEAPVTKILKVVVADIGPVFKTISEPVPMTGVPTKELLELFLSWYENPNWELKTVTEAELFEHVGVVGTDTASPRFGLLLTVTFTDSDKNWLQLPLNGDLIAKTRMVVFENNGSVDNVMLDPLPRIETPVLAVRLALKSW